MKKLLPLIAVAFLRSVGGGSVTKRIVIGLTALIAAIDVALVATGGETISEFLYVTSREYPVVALVAGIVVGHIWWPVKVSK